MHEFDTDLTFFTNTEGQSLLDRFKATLRDTRFFDVLVGYFHSSGFYQLYQPIQSIEKTRILIGIGVDKSTYYAVNQFQVQSTLDFESHSQVKKRFQDNLERDVYQANENCSNDELLEQGLRHFINFLNTPCNDPETDRKNGGNGNKLEIRAYPSRDIHAKVYIGRFFPEDRDYGFIITGSSNFSYSGLVANREFNVELRQKRDVQYALDQFESLWRESVDISHEFINTINNKTWLNDSISPYELYLKLLYEYLQEDINLQDEFEAYLPKGFMKLQYQQQAVIQAKKKLEEFNGVFIADVVGLGKTFITAQLLQQLKGNFLVICPPVLLGYWQESLHQFHIFARVESLGKLDQILNEDIEKYNYVVIDEAHRFRNESTQSYAHLLEICRGKKIILVTATPLNNRITDIFAQLKLFQPPKKSTIPGISNLDVFFNRLEKKIKNVDRHSPEYRAAIAEISREIRENILKHVMVRRTRSDVVKYFQKDIKAQGLFFPEMQDPQRIIYKFQGQVERVFNQTIMLFQQFRYTRYIPLLYYYGNKRLTEFEKQSQRNVGGFMKSLMVKRMESSFYAFKKSIERFITSYVNFIDMFKSGTVYISKTINVYDFFDNDDIERLETLVQEDRVNKYDSRDFQTAFLTDLQHDLDILKTLQTIWHPIHEDPKLDQLIDELKTNSTLKKKKLVIFTESKETGDYLYDKLSGIFPGKVFFYCSAGARLQEEASILNRSRARGIIQENFDPNCEKHSDNIQILISTDVLAEGVNLHRANILINYDLPWNPTRVLQRAGRVNRLGTEHSNIYIFNFFPTSQSDMHLGLEANITNKIQMFHHILGEDAKYLTDGEEIGSQELFETLCNKNAYTGEEIEEDSELKYLEIIRNIRDTQPDLFDRIKKLPKKARSGFLTQAIDTKKLVTFFRLGKLKKFYINHNNISNEITFFNAVRLLETEPNIPRAPIPTDYFQLLEANRERFVYDTRLENDIERSGGGSTNLSYIERRLKAKEFRVYRKFTETDEEFLANVRKMIAQGTIAKKVAQIIKKEMEKTMDPLDVLFILRKHIHSAKVVESEISDTILKREVILSGYLLKDKVHI